MLRERAFIIETSRGEFCGLPRDVEVPDTAFMTSSRRDGVRREVSDSGKRNFEERIRRLRESHNAIGIYKQMHVANALPGQGKKQVAPINHDERLNIPRHAVHGKRLGPGPDHQPKRYEHYANRQDRGACSRVNKTPYQPPACGDGYCSYACPDPDSPPQAPNGRNDQDR
jgi:hypothetical protein